MGPHDPACSVFATSLNSDVLTDAHPASGTAVVLYTSLHVSSSAPSL